MDVLQLSEPERKVLQKVALDELNNFSLGVTMTIPKGKSQSVSVDVTGLFVFQKELMMLSGFFFFLPQIMWPTI